MARVNSWLNDNHSDEKASAFVCLYLTFNELNAMLQSVFGLEGNTLQLFKLAIQMILFVFLIRAILANKLHGVNNFISFEIIFAIPFALSWLVFGENAYLSNWLVTMVIVNIPLLTATCLIKDKSILFNRLLQFSWIIMILSAVNYFGGKDSLQYNMHFSYTLILVILLQLTNYFKTHNIIFLILPIIEMMGILIFGSRGALGCLAIFLLLRLFFSKIKLQTKLIAILIGVVVVFIVTLNFRSISISIGNFLIDMGFSGRTINLLAQGQLIEYDTNRVEIWQLAVVLIKERPILGWGIGGATQSLLYAYKVTYPHQIFLDFILNFGVPIGLVLSFAFLYPIHNFWKLKNDERNVFLIFASIIYVSLMFTHTVFTDYYFYIFLGLVIPRKFTKIGLKSTR